MKNLKAYLYALVFLFLPVIAGAQNTPEREAILSVERIWDRGAHNAFTSLIDFNGTLYCAFRESNGHVNDSNGSIRVIASEDGQNWKSVAHLFEQGIDFRDPQLSITPDNKIMLNIGGSVYTEGKLTSMSPKVSFSNSEGNSFSKAANVNLDSEIKTGTDWLWRATWHNGKVYAGVYQPKKEKSVQLMVSDDGIDYKFITTFDVIEGNETTLRFNNKNEMIAVVRRGSRYNGAIGISAPPYNKWNWNDLEKRLGGPDLMLLENNVMLCATREYLPNKAQTIISKVELNGKTTKLITLPSEGDCSYPGLLMKDDILFMSYYSSHEDKTAIYLAKIAYLKSIFEK
ncbi:hypothetical protein [Aurantibacter sp.]|uniref:hypothetical protein n=1 Tax=Aurantibacter sp. TaxID=2807103 RepID=UPI003267CC98